ncbi:unnamed protein product, partial [Heterosigma akashiwo]
MLVGVAEKYVLAFDTPEKIESWDSVTDSGYGGKSRANIQHIVGSSSTYARFSGNTSLHKSGKLVRSGFCAIRSQKWEPPLPLEDFEGLEISLRTDGRTYTLNMEPEAFMPNELYQGFLTTQPGKWDIVQLPFNRLLCTLGGYPKTNQQQVDKLKLISLGIAIADGKEGEFQVDIEYIKAIR